MTNRINELVFQTLRQSQENQRALKSICGTLGSKWMGGTCSAGPSLTAPSMPGVFFTVLAVVVLMQVKGR